jgi:hypothetical protein
MVPPPGAVSRTPFLIATSPSLIATGILPFSVPVAVKSPDFASASKFSNATPLTCNGTVKLLNVAGIVNSGVSTRPPKKSYSRKAARMLPSLSS